MSTKVSSSRQRGNQNTVYALQRMLRGAKQIRKAASNRRAGKRRRIESRASTLKFAPSVVSVDLRWQAVVSPASVGRYLEHPLLDPFISQLGSIFVLKEKLSAPTDSL